MFNYGDEYPGPNGIARVESPISHQNADEAYDQMMFIKVIALLVANQDQGNGRTLDPDRHADLGRLIFFLAEHPAGVLGELALEKRDAQSDVVRPLPLNDGGA